MIEDTIKIVGLPAIKVGLTNRMCTDVFSQLMDLTATAGGKKKKGKGKKKVIMPQLSL